MKTSRKKADPDKVYLVPNADGTWKTIITNTPPTSDAALISNEGTYPVDVYYYRSDLNGSSTLEKDCCQTREELIHLLDWLSQCGSLPRSFWSFDYHSPIDSTLNKILNSSYDRSYQQRQQALNEIESEMGRSHAPSLGTNPKKSYCVILTKNEMDKLILALDVMGDRMADREGYSAGEDYWDLKEKLEKLKVDGSKQKSFGQMVNDARAQSSAGRSLSHAKNKEDELEM